MKAELLSETIEFPRPKNSNTSLNVFTTSSAFGRLTRCLLEYFENALTTRASRFTKKRAGGVDVFTFESRRFVLSLT